MMDNKMIRNVGAAAVFLLWAALAIFAWLKPADVMSVAERRELSQKPAFTAESFADGSYAADFEDYCVDQFPLRDSFRRVKSVFSYYGLWHCDNNGIYIHDGYVEKLDYQLNQEAVQEAQSLFEYVYTNQLQGKTDKIYMAVVPDKGYYLTAENGYPAMDYDALMEQMRMPWAKNVDLTSVLTIQDYYRTDTHWRQEKLLPVATRLSKEMGQSGPSPENYTPQEVERPFFGVYYGQAALPMKPDTMYVMESPVFRNVTVTGYNKLGRAEEVPLYDWNAEDDLYDVFMNGSSQSLLVLENPNAKTDRELVIFRDSFGCSLAPLFLEDYAKVTLIDLRVLNPVSLNMINYQDADVLFLFSTLVLNNPDSFRMG